MSVIHKPSLDMIQCLYQRDGQPTGRVYQSDPDPDAPGQCLDPFSSIEPEATAPVYTPMEGTY